MDLDTAEPGTSPSVTSRRGLFGALGAAGLASAAALAISRPAAAAVPVSPTDADKALLDAAMRVELTARDLYEEGLRAGIVGEAAELVTMFADNHEAYADAIAGAAGFSADSRNDEVFDELQAQFAVSNLEDFARAARELENTLAATHTELMDRYESTDARTLTASIVVVEARMAVVLADVEGLVDDLDEILDPPGEALELSGGAV